MEKSKKFELLLQFLQELELKPQEVVELFKAEEKGFIAKNYCDMKTSKFKMLSLFVGKFKNKIAKMFQYQTPKKVTPGMFVYTDGLIYPKIIEGRQIKAVIGSVEGHEALAVCLQEKFGIWSDYWVCLKEIQKWKIGGQEATRKILEALRQWQRNAEAAQLCYEYDNDGIKRGEAFLPSMSEWEKLFANKAAINASLNALGVALLKGYYWSSTEYAYDTAWRCRMKDGGAYHCCKRNAYYVRPVIAIKL